MQKLISWLLIVVFSIAIGGIAIAAEQNNNGEVQPNVEQSAIEVLQSEPKGWAVDWLAMLWGDWVKYVAGIDGANPESYTVMTVVVGYINTIAYILIVLLTVYNVVSGVADTVEHGKLGGQNFSTFWYPIRLVLSFGALSPVFSIGGGVVSVIQVVGMWLLLLSSKGGDLVYLGGMEQLMKGVAFNNPAHHADMVPFHNIARMAICTVSHQRYMSENTAWYYDFGLMPSPTSNAGAVTTKMGFSSSVSYGQLANIRAVVTPDVVMLGLGFDSSCGSIYFGELVEHGPVESSGVLHQTIDAQRVGEVAANAARAHLIDFTQRAFTCANLFVNQEDFTKSPFGPGYVGGIEKYKSFISSKEPGLIAKNAVVEKCYFDLLWSAKAQPKNTTHESKSEIIANHVADAIWKDGELSRFKEFMQRSMTEGGWASFGMWYYQIAKWPNFSSDAVAKALSGVKLSADATFDAATLFGDDKTDGQVKSDIAGYTMVVHGALSNPAITSGMDVASLSAAKFSVGCSHESCPGEVTEPDDFFVAALSRTIIEGANWLGSSEDSGSFLMSGGGDENPTGEDGTVLPFQVASNIGHANIKLSSAMLALYIAMALLSAVLSGVGKIPGVGLVAGVGGILVNTIFEVLQPFMQLAIGATAVNGYILAYAIPFMPTMIWVSQIVGWLVMGVEAMVFLPLSVYLLNQKEGDGISGTNYRTVWAVIAAIITRPALTVVGGFASIAVGYVAFAIYNKFFWGQANSINGDVVFTGVFNAVGTITLYTGGLVVLCKYIFSLQYEIPNAVNQAIGFTSKSFGESQLDLSNSGEAGGKVISEVTASLKKSEKPRGKGVETNPAGGGGGDGGGDGGGGGVRGGGGGAGGTGGGLASKGIDSSSWFKGGGGAQQAAASGDLSQATGASSSGGGSTNSASVGSSPEPGQQVGGGVHGAAAGAAGDVASHQSSAAASSASGNVTSGDSAGSGSGEQSRAGLQSPAAQSLRSAGGPRGTSDLQATVGKAGSGSSAVADAGSANGAISKSDGPSTLADTVSKAQESRGSGSDDGGSGA